jgi:predicted aspartyl protease
MASEMRSLVCALFAASLLPFSARSEAQLEVHSRYRDGLLWLKVDATGKSEPLNFLLDTGAGVSAIDLQTARSLGLHLGNRQTVQGVNGQCFAYRVNDFQAVSGGIVLPESVLAIDLRALSDCCEQPVNGILGCDFFRGRIVRIDFTDGRVRILEKCDANLANGEILPTRLCNDAFCVPVRVAGNPAQWMRLDTGCDAALEWVVSGTEKGQTGKPSIGLSGVSIRHINTSVQIGKLCFKAVNTGIHTEQIFPGEAGLIGNGLLSKFRLTIDAPRNRAIFENPM